MKRVDVAVIGAGVMGSATAWALARARREVAVFERFAIGHAHGSSHGCARIFRESYTDPRYVEMMREAIPLWRELEDECGDQMLAVTGALNVGEFGALEAAMAAAGSPFERLGARAVAERFPGVAVDGEAILDRTAGVVAADRAWRALARAAVARGAALFEDAPASLGVDGDEVVVEARGERWRARAVVVTAGSWVRDVLGEVGLDAPVRPSRETVAYYDLGGVEGVPVVIDWREPLVYSLPTPDGTFKAGEHAAGPAAHPDEAGHPDAGSLARVDSWVAARFPARPARRASAETCMYTNTADEAFILERRGPVVIGSACSGHGFKFAPLVGARLAELAMQ